MNVDDLQQRLTLTTAAGKEPDDFYVAIEGDPVLITTIDGASTLTVKINDPLRTFLAQIDSPSEAKKATATIDGTLKFNLAHVSKAGNTLTCIYEDALISRLRAITSKLVMKPGTLTYAAFIRRLASEAGVQASLNPADLSLAKRSLARSMGASTSNSWQVIADIAARNGWRCFSDGSQLIVGNDAWLLSRGTPLQVAEFADPVDRIDFAVNPNASTHTATLRVVTPSWSALPGDVIKVTEAGPANGNWIVAKWTRGLLQRDFSNVQLIQATSSSATVTSLDARAAHRPNRLNLDPMPAEVVRVEGTSVYAVPIGGDRSHPLGPCHGQKTKFKTFTAVTGVSGSPAMVSSSEASAVKRVPIAVGDTVLLVETLQGPWILAVEE